MEHKKAWETAEVIRLLYKLKIVVYGDLDKTINELQIAVFEGEI